MRLDGFTLQITADRRIVERCRWREGGKTEEFALTLVRKPAATTTP